MPTSDHPCPPLAGEVAPYSEVGGAGTGELAGTASLADNSRRGTRFCALTPLLLFACSSPDQPANTAVLAKVEAQQQADAEDDGRVLCARGGADLTRTCTVEQTQGPTGLVLTLRHPDGGFRRLRVATDGRGVVAADGAETAKVTVIGPGDIEVAVAGDRYRLPATVKR